MAQSVSTNPSNITTYGALILPFNIEETKNANKTQTNPKDVTKQKGKIKSAFKKAKQNFSDKIKSNQNVKILSEYMQDKRNMDKLGSAFGVIGSKFSGIAVTQAIIDGKVTSQEALDYFFMGFAPALGVEGSLLGYSGLNQMKDAFSDGTINVGAFVSGFTKTLKGITDLKDMLSKKDVNQKGNILEFDLTLSHSESYQSESPDRRVQSGQSLNEFIHNMPDTFQVQCALQEGKRYSKAEFRAIIQDIRKRKEVVKLVLGDEIFDNLILTGFEPNHDCTKSGMDYVLSFKHITRSDVKQDKEVIVQTKPTTLDKDTQQVTSYGSLSTARGTSGGVSSKVQMPKIDEPKQSLFNDVGKQISDFTTKSIGKTKSLAAKIKDEWDKRNKK